MNLYNEIDPYCAAWLRNLIKEGHLPKGVVDERSITNLDPEYVGTFSQFHTFAGIGGWPYALALAGWPDDRLVWTGSCPCQPFSVAGKQRGSDDERHLWPAFFRLIKECHPTTVFGEQVAGASGLAWLDHVASDLEGENYSVAAADIPAASVGAPHKRQRLWWVASSNTRSKRIHGNIKKKIFEQPSFSWCKNYRGIEDLRTRCLLSQPQVRREANGVSGGLDQLHAFGNAIVPQVAKAFIEASIDAINELF